MELVTGDWHEITYRWEVRGKTKKQYRREPVLWVGEDTCVFESGNNNENFSSCRCAGDRTTRDWEFTWKLLNVNYFFYASSKWA